MSEKQNNCSICVHIDENGNSFLISSYGDKGLEIWELVSNNNTPPTDYINAKKTSSSYKF